MGKCVITCHHSPLHLFNTDTSMNFNFNWKNQFEEETASSVSASARRRIVSMVAGFSLFQHEAAFVSCSAPFALLASHAPPVIPPPHPTPPHPELRKREREAKFGWNSWLPWQRFVPPQRIGTGTGLSMSVCRQDLGHALC